ncbi:MAG: RNA polymerase sporulation sigma factor SigH [Lachnospiraceae bacterium]|nr:RNA polymerase sporulation sigma factor SigH [Lachnospiraceae bacterium]
MNERSYQDLTDEELISLYRDGDMGAIELLMQKYKELVLGKARTMYILGGDADDLIQEGMLGLFKAVRDYDSGRDASFRTFARLCVTRQLYNAVEASGRKKHLPLNSAISLNRTAGGTEEEEASETMQDLIQASSSFNPEELFLEKEREQALEEHIEKELSRFERQVLDLYLTGMGYTEIAHVLNRDEKSADNALQRIRNKLRDFKK